MAPPEVEEGIFLLELVQHQVLLTPQVGWRVQFLEMVNALSQRVKLGAPRAEFETLCIDQLVAL